MGLEDVLSEVVGEEEPTENEETVDEGSPENVDSGEEVDEEDGSDEGEADEEEEEPESEPKRTVPLAAHREERNKLTARAREAEAQARQLQMQVSQMQAYLQSLQQQQLQQPPQPQTPPAPTVDVGPEPEFRPTVSYEDNPGQFLREQNAHMQELVRHQNKVHAAQLDALKNETAAERQAREKAHKEQQDKQQQAQQQQEWQRQVDARIIDSEKRAAQDLPQYHEAVAYLYGVLHTQAVAELKLYGVPDSDIPNMAKELLRQRTRNTAAHVIQKGGEPAEAVYNYALSMGYKVSDDKLDRVAEGRSKTEGAAQMRGSPGGSKKTDDGDFLKNAQREAGLIR